MLQGRVKSTHIGFLKGTTQYNLTNVQTDGIVILRAHGHEQYN